MGIGTVPSQGYEEHETVLHCLELHGQKALILRDIYSKPIEGGKKYQNKDVV